MTDKKIAVHVTNEEQWDEIREYYGNEFPYGHGLSYARNLFRNKELAQTSDSFWGTVACYHDSNEYELLEFSEWQARVKGDSMVEKIEVPQAVYDEFLELKQRGFTTTGAIIANNFATQLRKYLRDLALDISDRNKNQLNLAKVMAGEAEFVPVEEKYLWQEKQGRWLGYGADDEITDYPNRALARPITESEIREKTSFDIDKLKKVSE